MVIAAVAASLVTDPGAIPPRIGGALVHAWRNAGEALVSRELAGLAEILEQDRADLRHAENLRDALVMRLQALQARGCADGIALVPAGLKTDHPGESPRTDREVVDFDTAIVALSAAIGRADRYIDSARLLIRARETDLDSLQALADSERARRDLTGLDGSMPRWESRAARTAELLGTPYLAAQ
jgi:hypothetical protein